LSISPSANVGIKTSAPAYALDVAGTVCASTIFTSSIGIGTIAPAYPLDVYSSSNNYAVRIQNSNTGGSAGGLYIQKTTGGGLGLSVDVTGSYGNCATFLGGRIGVGTTAPGYTLEIAGTAAVSSLTLTGHVNNVQPLQINGQNSSGANAIQYIFYLQPTAGGGIQPSTLSLYSYRGDGTYVTGIMAISPTGNIGLNTNPTSYKLDVNGTARVSTLYIGATVSTTIYKLYVESDSAAKPGTNTWTIASDERIKKNIISANLELCYSTIKSLPLRYFEWDSDFYDSNVIRDRHHIGFVAQEVKQYFPKSVDIIDNLNNFSNFHTLNVDQIYKAHIGATQRLAQLMEIQQSTIYGQQILLDAQQSSIAGILARI
jgi:hypothetical protein